MVVKHSFVV